MQFERGLKLQWGLLSLSMHRLMTDDFRRVFSNLVETWDHQFPRSDAPLAADREAWELADRNKLLRCS
jgi:hypothetical protein